MHPRYHFCRTFRVEVFASVPLYDGTSLSSRFSVSSSNHSGKSRNRFPDARALSLFFVFILGLGDRCPDFRTLVSSLRFAAGLHEVSSYVSCGNDVEDERALELEEPVANSGTTNRHEVFRTAQNFVGHFGQLWFFLTWPTHVECPCSSQSLPDDRTASVSLRICTITKSSRSGTFTVASSLVCTFSGCCDDS